MPADEVRASLEERGESSDADATTPSGTPLTLRGYRVTEVIDADEEVRLALRHAEHELQLTLVCIQWPADPAERAAGQRALQDLVDRRIDGVTLAPECQSETELYGELWVDGGDVGLGLLHEGRAILYERYFYNCPRVDTYKR